MFFIKLLLASQRNFGDFEGTVDKIFEVLNVREERVVGSVAVHHCILRVGGDALQEICPLSVLYLRDQKAATRIALAGHLRILSIGVHQARADLSEQKSNKKEKKNAKTVTDLVLCHKVHRRILYTRVKINHRNVKRLQSIARLKVLLEERSI